MRSWGRELLGVEVDRGKGYITVPLGNATLGEIWADNELLDHLCRAVSMSVDRDYTACLELLERWGKAAAAADTAHNRAGSVAMSTLFEQADEDSPVTLSQLEDDMRHMPGGVTSPAADRRQLDWELEERQRRALERSQDDG